MSILFLSAASRGATVALTHHLKQNCILLYHESASPTSVAQPPSLAIWRGSCGVRSAPQVGVAAPPDLIGRATTRRRSRRMT